MFSAQKSKQMFTLFTPFLFSLSVTLWDSLSEKKKRDKNLFPLFLRALSFEATYFEGTFPVYFEGVLRALFSSLI